MTGLGWLEGYSEHRRGMGHIRAEATPNGRCYFYARVNFPAESDWWPRTTETSTLDDAREWVDEQIAEYRASQKTSPRD